MTLPTIHPRSLIAPAVLGGLLFAVGPMTLHEPLGVALWSVVAAIVLLPAAMPIAMPTEVAQAFLPVSSPADQRHESLCHSRYAAACAPVIVGVAVVAGMKPAIVIAVVAASLAGGAEILRTLRLPATLAIAMTILGASIAFTWPIWAAGLLMTHDLGAWLQRAVNVSPSFALNAAIAPDAPLTHRPLAYRRMNLGQDVSYAMPRSVWPCVVLHAGTGLVGWIGRRWTRMNADELQTTRANDGHPAGA